MIGTRETAGPCPFNPSCSAASLPLLEAGSRPLPPPWSSCGFSHITAAWFLATGVSRSGLQLNLRLRGTWVRSAGPRLASSRPGGHGQAQPGGCPDPAAACSRSRLHAPVWGGACAFLGPSPCWAETWSSGGCGKCPQAGAPLPSNRRKGRRASGAATSASGRDSRTQSLPSVGVLE